MTKNAKIILLTVAVLLMIGIVMIYSTSAVYAFDKYGDSGYFVKRHLIYLAIGISLAVFCMSVPARGISSNARIIMLFCILLLVIVLVPGIGTEAKGARRWLRFFGLGVQPSEIAKIGLIIYLADLTARKKHLMQNLKFGFFPPLFVIGLTAGLVLIEPDLGTSVSILFIGFVVMFTAGARFKHMLAITLSMIPVLALAIKCEPYRMKRVLLFLNPGKDPRGAGFQLMQSFIALGSGGLLGVGLGASRQKLFYLPEAHTDFIFSIIGEELGFLGAASVLLLFAVLIWFLLRLSFKIMDEFASRVVLGISVMIAFEVMVNIGVSIGVLPTKGLPLPFISYGGSSLVCHMAAIGLVFNMARGAETRGG